MLKPDSLAHFASPGRQAGRIAKSAKRRPSGLKLAQQEALGEYCSKSKPNAPNEARKGPKTHFLKTFRRGSAPDPVSKSSSPSTSPWPYPFKGSTRALQTLAPRNSTHTHAPLKRHQVYTRNAEIAIKHPGAGPVWVGV